MSKNEVTPEEIERVLRLFPPNELPHVLARALLAEREKHVRRDAAWKQLVDSYTKATDAFAAQHDRAEAAERDRDEARRLIAEVRDHLTYPSNDPYRVKLDEFLEKLEGK